ncbi:hypothetical protein [Pedobacter agri]|uniref:hypothetical protein n=1 Tax=Pedobacter agri TaxID=454586 RepID=UPI002930E229|nr:hypothetical protein [Pedobacter agri]
MKGLSPWGLSAITELGQTEEVYTGILNEIHLGIKITSDSLWATISSNNKSPIHFRPCFVPSGKIQSFKVRKSKDGCKIDVFSVIGTFTVSVALSSETYPILRYKCAFTPSYTLFIPFWPKDILLQNHRDDAVKDFGEIHCSQRQTRSGLIYLTKPSSHLRILYFQNLTSLSGYCEQTATSLSGVVGGELPEIGLSLPPCTEKPLVAGKSILLSDAHICLGPLPDETSDQATDYLNMLAAIYVPLPKPKTRYRQWPKIVKNGLKDLIENPGCWSRVEGNSYLNAYLCDHETPPEIMVQLAVLLPLLDYTNWSGDQLAVVSTIKKGLPSFYDKKLKSILRWHPAAEDKLKGEEEQKIPLVMDSWYLHHPLLNLSRLALMGDKATKKLFLSSLDFAIKVAHEFNYEWPVFYKMDTLEILKAETEPGKGGEQDVAGLYALVMIQAYTLTKQKKYLKEAIKAADQLAAVGPDIMYQANNTAFAAGAMLRLFKITGTPLHLNLCYRCLASLFQNVQLWDCNYGYGKNMPTFFALFPLTDAPYTAAYEEQEVFCAFHDFLNHAIGVEILPSVQLLCGEYIRYLIDRAPFYYPTMLPDDMLSKEVKTGKVERDLWIALEDIHDGTEQSGAVGQEVYGAGNAFGILPRHFIRIEGETFMIYVDGPFSKVSKKQGEVTFQMLSHQAMTYRVKIVFDKPYHSNLYFKITSDRAGSLPMPVKNKQIEMEVTGNQNVSICWTGKQ